MCFEEMYGLAEGKAVVSRLTEIEEEKYRALTQSAVVSRAAVKSVRDWC